MNAELRYNKKGNEIMRGEQEVMNAESKKIKWVSAIFFGVCVAYLAACAALLCSVLLGG